MARLREASGGSRWAEFLEVVADPAAWGQLLPRFLLIVLLGVGLALIPPALGVGAQSGPPASGTATPTGSSTDEFHRAVGAVAQSLPISPATDLGAMVWRLLLAAFLGGVIAFRGSRRRNEFLIVHTNIMLAMTGALMMIVVGSDLARAFGLVGASSIARYRTPVNDPKALASLFVSMGAGIAVGVGLFELAIVATILVVAVEFVLERGGRLVSHGWYRPERSYELELETETPEDTLGTVRTALDAAGVTHTLMDYERSRKDDNVKVALALGVPEGVDTEKLTLQMLAAGARAVSWRQSKDF